MLIFQYKKNQINIFDFNRIKESMFSTTDFIVNKRLPVQVTSLRQF